MSGVSFIVTVYNKRPYLPRVLEAIRAQIGDFAREYVFVDDGSTDGSLDYLKAATADWQNCTIIAQANQGASAAMNRAVAAASKPYLKLVDADDLLAPQATLWLLEALSHRGAVLAYGRDGSYDPQRAASWPETQGTPRIEVIGDPLRPTLRNMTFNPTSMLMPRARYLEVGGADERVCCQDYTLALPLARLGSFIRVEAMVMKVPTHAPGRLSDNKARILHDVTYTLGHFILRNPDIPARDKIYAVTRAAGRAMKWSRRHGNIGTSLRFAGLLACARLKLVRHHGEAILGCCPAFGNYPERA